jgi:hypothetical protein
MAYAQVADGPEPVDRPIEGHPLAELQAVGRAGKDHGRLTMTAMA